MGGGQSVEQIKKIDRGEWMNVRMNEGYQIVDSRMGKGEGQIRVIPVDPKHEIDKQLKIYSYRSHTSLPLIRCYGAEFSDSQHQTMCGNQQIAKVLTQRIPKRLDQIRKLSYPESLCVLIQSLRGFEDLYLRAGSFQITDKMIGINNKGQPKVWLNQNFAENHPASEKPMLQVASHDLDVEAYSEKKMVEIVYKLVSAKCEPNGFPIELNNSLFKGQTTFENTLSNIEEYIKDKNIIVPSTVELVDRNVEINQAKQPSIQFQNTNRFTMQSPNPNQTTQEGFGLNGTHMPATSRFISNNGQSPSHLTYSRSSRVINYNPQPQQSYTHNYPQTLQNPVLANSQYVFTNRPVPYVVGVLPTQYQTTTTTTTTYAPRSGVNFSYNRPNNPIITSQVIHQY